MNKRLNSLNVSEKRLLSAHEGAEYVGLGMVTFREWAKEIKAVRRFGRSVRYDKKVIDEAINNMESAEE